MGRGRFGAKQPTPRKGAETLQRTEVNLLRLKQPTPRKGTETLLPPALPAAASRKQPTPRKGTETKRQQKPSAVTEETTHTPQGDGNALSTIQSPQSYRNNPHPARGRKLADLQLAGRDDLKHLHPARGRKHPLYVLVEIRHRNTSHPARGRKPCHCCIFCFT